MLVKVELYVSFAAGRVLVGSSSPDLSSNYVDVPAIDSEEIDRALGIVTWALRRQIIEALLK